MSARHHHDWNNVMARLGDGGGRSHGDGDDWKWTIISLTRKKSGKASVIREKIINFVI